MFKKSNSKKKIFIKKTINICLKSLFLGFIFVFVLEHKIDLPITLLNEYNFKKIKGNVFNFEFEDQCSIQCCFDNTKSFFGTTIKGNEYENKKQKVINCDKVYDFYKKGTPITVNYETYHYEKYLTKIIPTFYIFENPMSICDSDNYFNRFKMYIKALIVDINYVMYTTLILFALTLFFKRYPIKIRLNIIK